MTRTRERLAKKQMPRKWRGNEARKREREITLGALREERPGKNKGGLGNKSNTWREVETVDIESTAAKRRKKKIISLKSKNGKMAFLPLAAESREHHGNIANTRIIILNF